MTPSTRFQTTVLRREDTSRSVAIQALPRLSSPAANSRSSFLSMNRRTLHTSSQRDEGHLTGSKSNPGGSCRAATGQSLPGSWSQCASSAPWWLPMNRNQQSGTACLAMGPRAVPARGHVTGSEAGPAPGTTGTRKPKGCAVRTRRGPLRIGLRAIAKDDIPKKTEHRVAWGYSMLVF